MFRGAKPEGWLKAYLVFGLISFLLGFLGYLGTEPTSVSRRFAERWADFSARFPILADLNWLDKTAPAFNRFEMPTVLLVNPGAAAETQITDFYTELETELKRFSPNIIRITDDITGNKTASISNLTPLYRKYLLVGLETLKTGPADCQLTIGVPPYLAAEIFSKLAAALPDILERFDWEQQEVANGRLIIVRWNNEPGRTRNREMAGLCLTLFEAARKAAVQGYVL